MVEKEELIKNVWRDTFVEEGSLTRTISLVRKALDDENDRQEYIATVTKRGYRFVVPVREVAEDRTPFADARIMLAVLPFEDFSSGTQQEYFSDGLTEEMITQLGRLNPERLGVIARSSAVRYRGTQKTVQEIGRELGVAFVLEGSVRRERDRVRIVAQLIRVSDQTHLWAETYQRGLRDILALQNEVAHAIARQIQIKLTPEDKSRLERAPFIDPQAYEDFLKGRYLWNKRTSKALLERSVQHFKSSIRRAPSYAPAYVGLADSYLTLSDESHMAPRLAIAKAKAAARKALRIDEGLAEPRISLAHAYFHEFNWRGAESEFRRGLEINPSYSIAHYYFANYLFALGRADEAIAAAETAQLLDPVSAPAAANMANVLYFTGHYDKAIGRMQQLLELEPSFPPAYEVLGRAYEQKSMLDQAIAAFEKAVALSQRASRHLVNLAHGLALAGRKKEALAVVQELKRLAKTQYMSPFGFALVFLALGDKKQSLAWLARAYRLCDSSVPFMKVNPKLDPLRSHPRFGSMLRRIGLSL
jgi:TolB-like protein/Flp pilus assembly protein TadD